MYFKGEITVQIKNSPSLPRLIVVEANTPAEAWAKLIHAGRMLAAGAAPRIEGHHAIFETPNGHCRCTLEKVQMVTPESFLAEHLHICKDWCGELPYAELVLGGEPCLSRE